MTQSTTGESGGNSIFDKIMNQPYFAATTPDKNRVMTFEEVKTWNDLSIFLQKHAITNETKLLEKYKEIIRLEDKDSPQESMSETSGYIDKSKRFQSGELPEEEGGSEESPITGIGNPSSEQVEQSITTAVREGAVAASERVRGGATGLHGKTVEGIYSAGKAAGGLWRASGEVVRNVKKSMGDDDNSLRSNPMMENAATRRRERLAIITKALESGGNLTWDETKARNLAGQPILPQQALAKFEEDRLLSRVEAEKQAAKEAAKEAEKLAKEAEKQTKEAEKQAKEAEKQAKEEAKEEAKKAKALQKAVNKKWMDSTVGHDAALLMDPIEEEGGDENDDEARGGGGSKKKIIKKKSKRIKNKYSKRKHSKRKKSKHKKSKRKKSIKK